MAEAEEGRLFRLDAESCRGLLPHRDPEAHKFTFGRVTAVCGSIDYAGAAYLVALAAARGGAGLVAMAVPESLKPIFAGRLPEAILVGLPQTADGSIEAEMALDAILEREPDALIVGPGLKETDDYQSLIGALLTRVAKPVVVDAGAIGMLGRSREIWGSIKANCVIIPHAGEFERLTGEPASVTDVARIASARMAAAELRQVLVLKGARTVIAAADGRVAISPFANAALATAGSGDVLAGLVGALLAQGVEPFDAACLGVYLHGRAGERISFRVGNAGLLASDLPYEIALARHELDAHSS
ncbi:MAG: NAD(P)H-hydrate dehydratase [Candidatus Limnocylindrales bacterium]